MSTLHGNELDNDNLAADWERAGQLLFKALGEVATDLGGESFARNIVESASVPNAVWPDLEAFKTLNDVLKTMNDKFPGSAEQVMLRSEAIQIEIHEREQAELDKPPVLK